MTQSTERLISSLTEDLEPVRPLPRLRSAFAIVLAVWSTMLGLALLGHVEQFDVLVQRETQRFEGDESPVEQRSRNVSQPLDQPVNVHIA